MKTSTSDRRSHSRWLHALLMLVVSSCVQGALAQVEPVSDGLVAYYPFNGTHSDASGKGRHPTLITAGLGTDRFGRSGKALAIENGTGMVCPDQPGLSGARPRTLSIWFKADAGNRPTCAVIYLGRISTTRIKSTFGIISAATNNRWGFWGYYEDFYPVSTADQWRHHVVTYDGSTVLYYLDGVEVGRRATVLATDDGVLTVGIQPGFATDAGHFQGTVDDIRLYNRALSASEVGSLFEWESVPREPQPRPATAAAQVINGFLVGATVLDPGFGYVSNPTVTVVGGGGFGAALTASISNGIVASISVLNPGSGYTNPPTLQIAPPPMPPQPATATAAVVNGFVVGIEVLNPGNGYVDPPAVLVLGGGGNGALAEAVVTNGRVSSITVINPGSGYTSAPIVRIASPPHAPSLTLETSRVRARLHLVLGRRYQVQTSADLARWEPAGPVFTAESEDPTQEFEVTGTSRYFRVLEVP